MFGQKWVKKGLTGKECAVVSPLPPKDAVKQPGHTKTKRSKEKEPKPLLFLVVGHGGSHPGLTYR